MKFNRIMIAAPKSGSGKTTITCALLEALREEGKKVVSYKCGPDYIDPMFHQTVIGVPSKNLDTFFTDAEQTRQLFVKGCSEDDMAVLEGVMGLYDGLGGIREEGSSYHLAKVTKTPIILVVDAKGMGRSVAALIAGFLAYDTEHLIKGVLLNRMSKGYYDILKPMLEQELNIKVLGYFPNQKQIHLESRHLGLKMPSEIADIQRQLQEAAEELKKTVSLSEILELAKNAEELSVSANSDVVQKHIEMQNAPVIAVARDEAFCFYYEDNLRMLEQYGAKIVSFSPLHDKALPECDGLLLGGGYPELCARQLSENTAMRTVVHQAIAAGMPTVAECGGFLYLHDAILDLEQHRYEMAGVLHGMCQDTGKLVRFGYIELEEKESHFLPAGEKIRGHEFHYYDSTDNGESCIAIKPTTGRNYPCVICNERFWAGFPHLYYPSNPAFAEHFVQQAAHYRKNRGDKQ